MIQASSTFQVVSEKDHWQETPTLKVRKTKRQNNKP